MEVKLKKEIFFINNNNKRIALLIEYNGKNLVGWQKQNNGISVQGEIEKATEILFKKRCLIYGAGRTDAGVHANGQVAHLDIPKASDFSKKNNFYLLFALNAILIKTNIRIKSIQDVSSSFDARFSAKKRFYVYKFLCRAAPPSILKDQVWHIKKKINLDAMIKGAEYLVGKNDFSSFRSVSCQSKSPVKTLDKIHFIKEDEILSMKLEARSFLHNQVRIIAGTLIKVGIEVWDPSKIDIILKAKSRILAGETAPASGLYLEKINYLKKDLQPEWPMHKIN